MSLVPSFPNFNGIAPLYDQLAKGVYGSAQLRAQQQYLASIPEHAQVLILGGGTGWILTEVLRLARPGHVLFLEASEKMVHLAKERLQKKSQSGLETQVEFRVGTEKDLGTEEKFHVVLTPFVLDLFAVEQARQMVQTLDQHLLTGGLWLHTDFQESDSWFKKIWQQPLLWAMYRFFGWVSQVPARRLPLFRQLFQERGYTLEEETDFYGGFICAQQYRKPGP
ncbi:methyltransferase domain-containing protein [Nibribacter ruber]|uniref:Methyltransferase domain-containing protein n=1 Tax=Nibribacter ruber TaxID=2698458 RepID=A0A6P1P3G0_9BACT|nr:class I SAM-dependent methyltransferase [Nibribacter ruber]QHL88938.1 methyltransferase domain-containing protein [Nibribacter ruber]